MRLAILVLLLISLSLPSSTAAQTVSATGRRNLRFGTVLQGVPELVLWTDTGRRGEYGIRSDTWFAPVMIQLVLPVILNGPIPATMPITFGTTNAAYWRPFFGSIVFDPNAPVSFILFPRTARVYLGGTILPSASQTPGDYSATVTLIVAYTGS